MMNFRLAYEYSKKQLRRDIRRRLITVTILTLLLVALLVVIEGGRGYAEDNTLQTGTHGSVEAGSSGTGSGSTEATEPAGKESSAQPGFSREMATGEGPDEAVIFVNTKAEEGATDVESSDSGASDTSNSGYTSLGVFRITAYCACEKCCGKTEDDPAYGITYSGTHVTEGWTVAADPDVLPMGTMVSINDHVYHVEDIGAAGKGNTIDIYMGSHESAQDFGVQEVEVFILEGGIN